MKKTTLISKYLVSTSVTQSLSYAERKYFFFIVRLVSSFLVSHSAKSLFHFSKDMRLLEGILPPGRLYFHKKRRLCFPADNACSQRLDADDISSGHKESFRVDALAFGKMPVISDLWCRSVSDISCCSHTPGRFYLFRNDRNRTI